MKPFNAQKCFDNTKKYRIGVLRKIDLMLPCKSN